MLANSKLIVFAAITDAGRARDFYCGLLGLPAREESEFALVLDANGVELRLQKVDRVVVPPYTSLGWQVDSVTKIVRELAAKGVVTVRYGFLQQDEDGIWQSPSGARIAWFRDPDGNVLSLTEIAGDPGETDKA
ncbi:MAG: hypothetical protein LJE67_12715 [Salaquimonas sp.]|nr:hypothetical protein [Salaquimonas sp.]